jgi:hypothetical protein
VCGNGVAKRRLSESGARLASHEAVVSCVTVAGAHPNAPYRIDRWHIRPPVSDVLIGEWKSYPHYRLHRPLVAVQLSTPDGVPTLAELNVGKIVHLIGESPEPGSVQVVCDDGQTYQVFLEDLRDRGEQINDSL